MRVSSRLFRVSLLLASTSLSLASTVVPAFAQPAPPPDAPADASAGGDPPAIAGRVSDVSGTVSFHAAGDTNWAAATMNYPVTNGDGFWTEPTAHTALQIGDDSVVLAGSTEFEISALDASKIAATEAQGASFLNIPSLPNGQTVAIDTPRGQVQISTPGRYELVAGDTNDATTVTVVEGAAHIEGTGVSLDVAANQTATIGGTDTFTGSVGAMQEDQFLRTQLEQAQQVQQRVAQLPQDVRYMTGGTALAESGSFETTQQYGEVWYPRGVAADWAPYRDGHWAYVAPWGWNWVDNASWGFAPFHYGRWVQYGGRWGWCAGAPGIAYGGGYPVYSPALVSFVGVGGALLAGAAFGFGVGFGHGGGIGWVPLGFNEPYYPSYHVSQRYFENINRYSVTNIRNYNVTNIRNVTVDHFANARYATVMPESAMVRGEGGSRFVRPLPVAALSQAHPVFGRPPVAPTRETPNLSRAAAREYHVPEQHEAGRGAPGPAIRPEAERGHGPVLRAAAPPPNVRAVPAASVRGHEPAVGRPGEALRPGEAPRPGEASSRGSLPGLRAPGAPRPATAPVEAGREATPHGVTNRPGEAARETTPRGVVSRPGEAPRSPEAADRHTAAGLPALRGPGAAPPGADRHAVSTARAPERHEAARPEARAPEAHAAPAVHTTERPVEHYATPRSEPVRAEPRRAEPVREETRRAEPARSEPRAEPREAPHREAAPRPAEAPRPAPHAEAHAAPHAAPHPEEKR